MLEVELKILREEHGEDARGCKAKEERMKAQEDTIKGRDAELEQMAQVQAAKRG